MTDAPLPLTPPAATPPRRAAAHAVTAAILLSKVIGLGRDRVLAHYLGSSDAAGAFRAALRIPNFLQNLFGEGVLSASFIPVYARLKAEGEEALANQVAGTVLGLMTALIALLVGAGMLLTRPLTELLAPGYTGAVRTLTGDLVFIMFPGVGLLVLSAWSLGVLNSHRRFFLPYVAPVLWNVAIIATISVAAASGGPRPDAFALARAAAWGTAFGAVCQLGIQLPAAARLNGGFKLKLDLKSGPVRKILHNFLPALLSRGGGQLSAYVDGILASYLGPAAVATMAFSQAIYTLPIALFGTAVAAAELPEMSVARGTTDEVAEALRGRLKAGLNRIAFYIVPSAVAFVVLGDVVAATLYQTGAFSRADSRGVWTLLIGAAVGLLATTQSRLCVSAFWALHDTRTPTRYAIFRLAMTAGLGTVAVFPLRAALGLAPLVAAGVLVATAGVAGWIEFLLIRRALVNRIGPFHLGRANLVRCWLLALIGAAAAFGVKVALPALPPPVTGALVLGCYAAIYLGGSFLTGAEEVRLLTARLTRRRGRQ